MRASATLPLSGTVYRISKPTMGEIGTTNPEYQPRSCAHTHKTIPLAPIHPFTKQMVPSLCPEWLTRRLSKSFLPVFYAPYKVLPSIKTFLRSFFLCFFLSFSLHTFSWACGSLYEPRKYFQILFLCIHFFVE